MGFIGLISVQLNAIAEVYLLKTFSVLLMHLELKHITFFWRNEYGAQEIRLDFLTGRLRESFRHTTFFTRLKCNAILIKEGDCLLEVNLVEYGRSHPIRGANGIL